MYVPLFNKRSKKNQRIYLKNVVVLFFNNCICLPSRLTNGQTNNTYSLEQRDKKRERKAHVKEYLKNLFVKKLIVIIDLCPVKYQINFACSSKKDENDIIDKQAVFFHFFKIGSFFVICGSFLNQFL
ncbi:hypothetical protein RFI_04044 [Reticulomyxa filosa]|uniref:Transmembrane protein n=1 Tax=Reticulomyxa filosa TaxID=46433 RepID=X6P4Q8_RETFI|nr:hypothetical protein RFI_04044 [Reticulomyxa filosa]|eukprot:ETO33064.1 hypothetical protein RFI_04044 [Reticulomyxa filosa]